MCIEQPRPASPPQARCIFPCLERRGGESSAPEAGPPVLDLGTLAPGLDGAPRACWSPELGGSAARLLGWLRNWVPPPSLLLPLPVSLLYTHPPPPPRHKVVASGLAVDVDSTRALCLAGGEVGAGVSAAGGGGEPGEATGAGPPREPGAALPTAGGGFWRTLAAEVVEGGGEAVELPADADGLAEWEVVRVGAGEEAGDAWMEVDGGAAGGAEKDDEEEANTDEDEDEDEAEALPPPLLGNAPVAYRARVVLEIAAPRRPPAPDAEAGPPADARILFAAAGGSGAAAVRPSQTPRRAHSPRRRAHSLRRRAA